jgi:hypothetical protein
MSTPNQSIPALVQIVKNMQTALRNIKAVDGYNNTIEAVIVDPTNELISYAIPAIGLGHLIEPMEKKFNTSKPVAVQERWKITLEVVLEVQNDLDDTQKKFAARMAMAADVEYALTRDCQRGGLALYTYVGQDSAWPDISVVNRFYMQIPVEILMQRAYGTQ